jgi:hypothetical protein
MTKAIWAVLGVVLFIALTASGKAQVTAGTISGTLTDSTGAVLPGAKVVILNENTGISRTVQADSAGRYSAPSLSLGKYQVTASLTGFQTEVRSGIELTLGRQAVVNFQMQVGAVNQSVEVSGEAPLVDTVSGSVGELVESATITELPLNGRDLTQLITLGTGNSQYSYGEQAGQGETGGKLMVISGSRPTTNVFLIDGTPIESSSSKTPTGVSGIFLGVEAVEEFRVESNSYSAQFGRGGGGVFNIVTKSGANRFHGSVFEFLRNAKLDAAKWEDNAFGNSKPAYKRNQFGFSLGGPIKKDKTFFFGTYEGFRERLGNTNVSQTFSDSLRQGFLTNPTTGVVTKANIDPTVVPYLNSPDLWPRPNGALHAFADGTVTGDFVWPFSQPTDENFFQVRVDHHLSDRDSLFARFTFDNGSQHQPGSFPQFDLPFTARNQYLTLGESRIFSPTLLNSFHFGFTRIRPFTGAAVFSVDPSLLFTPTPPRMGSIGISGVSGVGSGIGDRSYTVNSFQWIDDASYTKGKHSIKFGFAWDHIQFNGRNGARDTGEWTFGSILDFFGTTNLVNGLPKANPSRFRGEVFAAYNDPTRSFRQNLIGPYFQDDIQITRRFTLNLGLRYEFWTVPTEKFGRIGNFRGDLNFIQHATSISDESLGSPWFNNPARKNFAPRIGFAWDVFGNGKTAVRGGFGKFFEVFDQSVYNQSGFREPPFLIEMVATKNIAFPNIFALCGNVNPFVPVTDPRCSAAISPDFPAWKMKNPYVLQYNLNIQREVYHDTVLTAGYVGSRGVNLPAVTNLNIPQGQDVNGRLFFPTTATLVNPNFNQLLTRFNGPGSWYNALQLSLNRKLRQGLQFGLSYTFSKNIDVVSGSQTASDTTTGPNSLAYFYHEDLYKGLAVFDVRNLFSLNATYELPIGPGKRFGSGLTGVAKWLAAGWQPGGILSLGSGTPGTIAMSTRSSLSTIGLGQDLPDLAPGASSNPSRAGNPIQYFDPAAFLVPPSNALGTFLGNLGRSTLILPGRASLDFSLSKNMQIGESVRMQYRFEAFNFLNRPNFGPPTLNVFNSKGVPNVNAGRISSTATSSRQIQMGLKLVF